MTCFPLLLFPKQNNTSLKMSCTSTGLERGIISSHELATLPEDPISVARTHIKWLTMACNSHSRRANALFETLWTPAHMHPPVHTCTHTHTHVNTHTHLKNLTNIFKCISESLKLRQVILLSPHLCCSLQEIPSFNQVFSPHLILQKTG